MADKETKRKRTVRSITLDDDLVEQFKASGETLMPKETNLSRLLDRAMAEFIEIHPAAKRKGRK